MFNVTYASEEYKKSVELLEYATGLKLNEELQNSCDKYRQGY